MPSPAAAPSTRTASPTLAQYNTGSSTNNTTTTTTPSSAMPAAMPSVTSASTPLGGGSGSGGAMARPPIMKRHSSQSSHGAVPRGVTSPGSASEHHPLRHTVGGAKGRHAKIVLPRNHSSGRNLAKMGRQAAAAQQQAAAQFAQQHQQEDGRKHHHARQRSHEGDTEIRLPGSLDEDRPAMRRNMTASELPRNQSRTKLKKNLSHGQLTRLSSGKNLAAMGSGKNLAGMGLKGGKRSRPQSEEIQLHKEKDLHEQEVELLRQQEARRASRENGGPKRVGFAVGSVGGDTSAEDDETTKMEGTEPQEDEWTEESASASPYGTRQNTANNSRRTSVAQDKPPDRAAARLQHPAVNFSMQEARSLKEVQVQEPRKESQAEADGTPAASDASDESATSPKSMPPAPIIQASPSPEKEPSPPPPSPPAIEKQAVTPVPHIRSPLHGAKEHPNPTAKRLTSAQLPAPALLSSISALDDGHSGHGSPAPSLRSARSALGNDGAADQDADELVSRFVPSASHPTTGSGSNTNPMNTPRTGSLQGHTPEDESSMPRVRTRPTTFRAGPVSPDSTRSGSSGVTTPAMGRSRIELKMMQDKALADREAAAERQPLVPHHIYDRRNETLKSYLNLATLNAHDGRNNSLPGPTNTYSMGPEIFQGRFKAVNTELKVVQKFRDPIADSLERLRKCRNAKTSTRLGTAARTNPAAAAAAATELKMSKSAVSLPARPRQGHEPSKLSTSASPPSGVVPTGAHAKSESPQKSASALIGGGSKSAVQLPEQSQLHSQSQSERRRTGSRRGVSFAGAESTLSSSHVEREREREGEGEEREMRVDGIARMLWNSVG
ncbi:hypothetical protein LTR78_001815 [Recurvomyces mirabilis]|uniref:Uncharacterized protein n=1 Tax=Recurvomyces mirabilis TaxID=574656 RepID=A0AAE0WVB1_9PEZI|nr:hypothetical protein LTR78_001815 [Recurvomyces mirabilis]KAK5156744.1 hypothetical protein LTS14_004957 [Recurvomyces mirabilis]